MVISASKPFAHITTPHMWHPDNLFILDIHLFKQVKKKVFKNDIDTAKMTFSILKNEYTHNLSI